MSKFMKVLKKFAFVDQLYKEEDPIKTTFMLRVTARIIVIRFPGQERITLIAKELTETFKNSYMVYNLSEHKYDTSHFNHNVIEYYFPGGPVPPLHTLFEFCQNVFSC